MPLLTSTLTDGLMAIDANAPPKDIPETAQKWADAWGGYVAGCTQLSPAAPPAMKQAFKNAIASAFAPVPVPLVFMTALEGAMRAGWAVATVIPPLVSITPAPAPFAATGVPAVVAGLASPSKRTGREALATAIHTWTLTHIVQGPSGPSGPVS